MSKCVSNIAGRNQQIHSFLYDLSSWHVLQGTNIHFYLTYLDKDEAVNTHIKAIQ